MASKNKFVIEFSPIDANQFVKNGVQLNRSWADHVIGKTIKQLIPVLTESIEKNRQVAPPQTSKTSRDEAIAVIDMLLQRHHNFIVQSVYTNNMTCKDMKANGLA